MSLVAAGVMTYLMFSGLDEGFYQFSLGVVLQDLAWCLGLSRRLEIGLRCEKKEFENEKSDSLSFIGLSLEVWLVEMFTGWFDHALFTNSSLVPGIKDLWFLLPSDGERSGWKENIMNMIKVESF